MITSAVSASAVTSSLWEQNTKNSFDAGEPDGVSIIAPGRILLAPKAQTAHLNARYAWTLAEDSAGRLYAGSGSDGRIFFISPNGTPEPFAQLKLQQIFALLAGKNGTLYAGGFPGGKIYTINPKGEVAEHYDTGQAAVWALWETQDGTLMAGTGDDGKLFAISPDRKGRILYDSRERRLLSLIGDDRGNVFAGTDQNGIIYRFDRKGKPAVFHDTELEEVTAMTLDAQGNLYAVSSPGDLFVKVSPPQNAPADMSSAQALGQIDLSGNGHGGNNGQPTAPLPGIPAVPTPKKRSCIIYKIDENGAASKFWVSPDRLIFSLAFAGEHLLAGSGDEGTIYIVSPGGEAGTFFKADQKQVLALRQKKDGSIAAGLGNDAAVIQFSGVYAAKGTFFSKVHDATAVSTWGRVFWEADTPRGTGILFSTRSGNSQVPDDTWSAWGPDGGTRESFVSPSPAARYIQWRAILQTSDPNESPELRKVTVAYIQNNLPPKIHSISVGGKAPNNNDAAPNDLAAAMKAMPPAMPPSAGQAENKPASNNEEIVNGPSAKNAKIRIQWQAQDQNNDKLRYGLFFRGDGEQKWKPLKKDINESLYDWDTETVPDGEYQVKVVASDQPANPETLALEDERMSDFFTIDNTSPQVEGLTAGKVKATRRYRVSASISDRISPLNAVHYSIDAGEWRPVFPEDGIFDSSEETVVFQTDELEEGEHTVVLKAVDYYGNIGAGKITFIAQ